MERVGRSIAWCVEFFSAGCVFPDSPGKTGLTGFTKRSDRFSPVGCREEFLSEKVSVVLWLFLFKGGVVREAVFLLERFLGSSGQNRPDRFPLPGERLCPTETV
jgi:hypothetical protein